MSAALLAEVERLRAEIVALRRDRGLQQARRKFNRARAETAEAALLAKSAAYDALVDEIARAPVGKVEVYDTPEQWRYVIVPDHFDSGSRVRLVLVREGGDGK